MKLRATLSVFVSLLLSLFMVGPTPALANTAFGCPDDYVCLYQWVNFGADRWQSSFYNLSIHTNGCVSLWSPLATWDNGTVVHDNSGSLIVNGSGAYSRNVHISVFGWDHCNSNGGISSFNANWYTGISDLNTLPIGNGINAYHNIASIQIAAL